MSKHDGGTAFPMQDGSAIHAYASAAIQGITDPEERDAAYLKARGEAVTGMSLRDFFAASALQGMLAGRPESRSAHSSEWAEAAYLAADAMLVARNQHQDPSP